MSGMCGLEQLDWVAVGIFNLNLSAAGTSLHLIATFHAGVFQNLDSRWQVRDSQHRPVAAVGRLASAGIPRRQGHSATA